MKKDKLLHFIAGMTVCLGTVLVYYCIVKSISVLLGFVAGLVAGIAKELYDEYDYGGFDYVDMLATWLGAIVGAGLVYMIL